MLISIYIVLILLLFFVLIFFSNIHLEVKINISIAKSFISIKIRALFGLIRIKKEISVHEIFSSYDISEEIKKGEDNSFTNITAGMQSFYEEFKPFQRILKDFINKIKIQHFSWDSYIGLGDASASAIAAGTTWSIKGAILSFLRTYLKFQTKPILSVHPNFQHFTAQTSLRCMTSLKAGNAILVGIKLFKEWKEIKNNSQKNDFNQELDGRVLNG